MATSLIKNSSELNNKIFYIDSVKYNINGFIISFFVCSISYFIFISQFLIHNHSPRLPWIRQTDQLHAGRWFNYILVPLEYGADIPVLLPVFGIALAITSCFIALNIYKQAGLHISVSERILYTIALITFPFVLSYFYYTFQTVLFFSAWIFAIGGAYFSRRAGPIDIAIASILVMLTSASYQASIGIFVVVIVTASICDLSAAPTYNLRTTIRKLASGGIALALGLLSYWASLKLLGLSSPSNASAVSFHDLPAQAASTVTAAFKHLWLTQPELLKGQKIALLVALMSAIGVSVYRTKSEYLRNIILILMWVLSIISTKFLFLFISTKGIYEYRYNGGLIFLHAFTFVYLISATQTKGSKLWWLMYLAIASVTVRFVQADLVRQGVLLRGQQHDLAMANRILSRIEALPLDPKITYRLIRIGRYSNYRTDLLASQNHKADLVGEGHMDSGEITAQWVDEDVFRLLGSSIKFKPDGYDPLTPQVIASAKKDILPYHEPWPASSSVFMAGNIIFVYMR